MPQVPTSFVPQVGVSGESANVQFVAPGIAPMENLAAQQQVQFGRATESLGNTVWRIGQIIEDDINTAMAKKQEGVALDSIEQLLNGQNGYMFTRGQDAEANFAATESAMAQRIQAAMDGLENDVQKAMFQQSISRTLSTARSRMVGHRNDQLVRWQAAESDARAKRFIGQAVNAYDSRNDNRVDKAGRPVGEYATNVQVALEEARKAGRLLGYPEDSEAMRGIQRGVMDGVAAGVVGRLVDRDDYNGAMAYLGSVKDQLNPATHETLLSRAYSGQRRAGIDEVSKNILNFGRVDSVALTRPYITPVPGATMERAKPGVGLEEGAGQGMIITASPDSPVHAPYDGIITHMERDESGLSVRIQLDDGRVATMRGMAGTSEQLGGLYAGKAISRNEVIGAMGKGTLIYQLEENGEPVSVTDVNSVAPKDANLEPKPPTTLEEALSLANLVKPEVGDVKAIRAEVKRRWAEREAAGKASYEQLVMQVDNVMGQPDGDWMSVPEHLWSQLSPADQEARMKPWREENDIAVLEEFARSPGAFDIERVMKLRGSLTKETYNRMLTSVSGRANQAAHVDAQRINATLINNGLDALAFPKNDEDRAASLLLRQRIEDSLRTAREAGPIDEKRRQEIIDNAVMNFGSNTSDSWWDWLTGSDIVVRELPLAAMTTEQRGLVRQDQVFRNIRGLKIPMDKYEQIRAAIIQADKVPTDENIRAVYEAGLKK